MGVPIDVEDPNYTVPPITADWQRCCLAYQGDSVPCDTGCLHCHRMAEVVASEREWAASLLEKRAQVFGDSGRDELLSLAVSIRLRRTSKLTP